MLQSTIVAFFIEYTTMLLTFKSDSLLTTKLIAIAVAKCAMKNDVFCLYGDLGSGKTAFCKEFISFLTGEPSSNIISPTFPIICSYQGSLCEINHLDLYRINSEHELEELGIEELMLNSICLIEWANKLTKFDSKNFIKIKITFIDNSNRMLSFDIPDELYPRFQIINFQNNT